jgi:hypothetical protein
MASYPMTERKTTFAPMHDVERGNAAGSYARLGDHLAPGTGASSPNTRPNNSRDSSFLHEATHYDYRKGPEQFRVAQGDVPDNAVGHRWFGSS